MDAQADAMVAMARIRNGGYEQHGGDGYADVCRHGFRRHDGRPDEMGGVQGQSGTQKESFAICPKCGSEMKKGLKFCSECGRLTGCSRRNALNVVLRLMQI
ncbi:MAG: zinc ribbon domain-containing protein [Blautia sp.]